MREMMACTKSLGKANFHKLLISVLESFREKQIFANFTAHMFDSEPLENHIHLLTKAVAEKYLHVRYYYAGKKLTTKLQSQVKVKVDKYTQILFSLAASDIQCYRKMNITRLMYILL